MPSHNRQSFAQIWSHEQPTCCSCHLRTAHGALPEPLRFLALLAHHMSAWCQCHHRSSFMANWTGAAGTGWSSLSLFWSLGFQTPSGRKFNAMGIPCRDRDRREAEFINSLLQSLRVSIRPPVRLCVRLATLTESVGCPGFACFHEVL